jgi:hypothetical protein
MKPPKNDFKAISVHLWHLLNTKLGVEEVH